MTLQISLNGQPVATDAATLQALLLAQGYDLATAFACAINNGFVPRTQWPERLLQMTPEHKRSNRRMALTLAAIAVAIFVGFMVKSAVFGF